MVGRIKAHNSNSGPIPKRIELRTIEDPMKLEILEILCTSRERGGKGRGGGGGDEVAETTDYKQPARNTEKMNVPSSFKNPSICIY